MIQVQNIREVGIGILGIGFALSVLFIWIPADIDTGVIDVWRRTIRIGDAMLPTFAALAILFSSAAIVVRAIFAGPQTPHRDIDPAFLLLTAVFLLVSLALMWVAGPALVWLVFSGEVPYRDLLDTAPWKYIGFVIGGTVMVFCFTALASHKLDWRHAVYALVAAILIALLYDLPFDNLLLPPNGDLL